MKVSDMELLPSPAALPPALTFELACRVRNEGGDDAVDLLDMLGLEDPRDTALEALWPAAVALVEAIRVRDADSTRAALDAEDKTRMLIVLAELVGAAAARCICGHLDLFHAISSRGHRTGCSWSQPDLCGCRRFVEVP